MSRSSATWLAWYMCALSLALTSLSLLLIALILNLSYPGIPIYYYWLETTLVAAGYSTVGAVIAPRCPPNNPIGWLFCAIGLIFGATHFSSEYATYALLAQPGSLLGGEAAAWMLSWLWVPGLGLVVFLGLLFPNGRLPSPRWRWFARFNTAAVLVGAILAAFSPGPILLTPIQNPHGIEGLPNVYRMVEAFMYALIVVAAGSMLVRLRQASEVERQQIKWFAYATTVAVSGVILKNTVFPAVSVTWVWWAGLILTTVGLTGSPVAMGVAILRFRLYEIDLIINRTLVYGALTAILALFYLGSVTALQYLLSLLTGQGDTLAIVASTLAIAALFNPLRRRIQGFIDRRFYRRKYDARKILEAFGSRLRDETDLERISEELVGVVRETMQPAHVSIWLSSGVPSSTTKEQGQQDQQTTTHEG
jgi:cytochrome b subunit of formate dehydrogenase